jgi:lauroyl/myristoyl acyltransferase
VTFRHFLSWRPLFYEALLPALRRLGPAPGDAVLGALGWLYTAVWPPRRRALSAALARARAALGTDWDPSATLAALSATIPRFLARDYLLDHASNARVFARFDVTGFEHVERSLASGRGVILLGSHLGGHLAALHWLYRQGVPLRLLVQRPRHVSRSLNAWFDRASSHAQSSFFLQRILPPSAAVERLLRARAALREGMAIYLTGDIPWDGPNARPGRLLGHAHMFLSVWTDLAVLTRTPVIPLFCTHRPGGRFALTFESPWTISPGAEDAAVARYLARLEAEIAAHPADAVAHLLWPCYNTPTPEPPALPRFSHASLPAARCEIS